MTMLSSVAERLYWTARYLERAEATARLTHAYTQFLLDTPVGLEPGWESLVQVIDGETAFEQAYPAYTEKNVVRFLVSDPSSSGSVRFSINAARENVRTTRDCLPETFWEIVNELRLFVEEHAEKAEARRQRFEFMDTLTARIEQLRGVIHGSMTRDQAYQFMQIGRHVECADMTSRVVDVVANSCLKFDSKDSPGATMLWINLLQSLSARSAYRREIGPLVSSADVVAFVFKSKSFTRSIHFCLNGIDEEIEGLADPSPIWKRVRQTRLGILGFDAVNFSRSELHECIDEFQLDLSRINELIYERWFHG